MSRCPDAGALRATLDGERPDLAAHLGSCPACRARSHEQAGDAHLAAGALGGPLPGVDVDAALSRFRSRTAEVVTLTSTPRRRFALPRSRVAALLVLFVFAGGVLSTPGGRAAASALLERFRAERLAVVPLDLAAVDPAALQGLVDAAQVEGLEDVQEPQQVADLAEAAAVSGIEATPLDISALPPDVAGPVTVLAQPPQTVRISFSEGALRDAVLVLEVPGAVLQAVGGVDGLPAVARGEAGTLEATVEGGPSLAEVRDALLALPGLPPETVAALRAIEDWETTLPLPVPVGQVAWQETSVNGRPGLAFGDETGLGSALLWREGDRFVGVGGMLPLSEVRLLAEER